MLSHGLLRQALSRWVPVAPQAWCFEHDSHGKPRSAQPEHAGIAFSLSRCPGMVAVVVSDQGRCGIDVEGAGRVSDPITTARAFFSPAEQALLMAAAPADRDRIFAAHWALKEAWAKAMGRGLDLPVQRVGFELGQDGRVTMSLPPALGTAADWRLELHHPTPDHVLAVALDHDPQQPVALGWWG